MNKTFTLLSAALLFSALKSSAQSNFFRPIPELPPATHNQRLIAPQKAAFFQLSETSLRAYLNQAPAEESLYKKGTPFTLELPMPEGNAEPFQVVCSSVMEAGLISKYPNIRTYAGVSTRNPSWTVRFDLTENGFHALVFRPEGQVYIDPAFHNQLGIYQSYHRSDYVNPGKNMVCETEDDIASASSTLANPKRSIGTELRTYRLALAATGEYSAFAGGTVAAALSDMVTSVNRVVGVYETELAIRLVLVANTDTLIFTDANTDPYTNSSGSTMLGQNQTTVTQRIGSANYDIGHVFSTGGGGIANLGCVCSSNNKARGVTGSPAPVGDPFDIDYVAHEMGHQFGGNHTFNSTLGSCGGGNRSASSAFEPGSGITIMAYAGICGNDDLAGNSIAYFHTKSFDQIITFSQQANGNNCPVTTPTGNLPPVINYYPKQYSMPRLAAFKLVGSATDPDGDTLTYSWEQCDAGPAGTWSAPTGNAPLWRNFNPSLSGERFFPKWTNVLSNIQTAGEVRPGYARSMKFRMVARDNRSGGAGVTYNDTLLNVDVINTTDTFKITYPNAPGSVFFIGQPLTLTWNVATTDANPINVSTVTIWLSTTGGNTFTQMLAQNVPNNGSYSFTVPNIQSNTIRFMVVADGNIFYDISDRNVTFTIFNGMAESMPIGGDLMPNPAQGFLYAQGFAAQTQLDVFNLMGAAVAQFLLQGPTPQELPLPNLAPGCYTIRLRQGDRVAYRKWIMQ